MFWEWLLARVQGVDDDTAGVLWLPSWDCFNRIYSMFLYCSETGVLKNCWVTVLPVSCHWFQQVAIMLSMNIICNTVVEVFADWPCVHIYTNAHMEHICLKFGLQLPTLQWADITFCYARMCRLWYGQYHLSRSHNVTIINYEFLHSNY